MTASGSTEPWLRLGELGLCLSTTTARRELRGTWTGARRWLAWRATVKEVDDATWCADWSRELGIARTLSLKAIAAGGTWSAGRLELQQALVGDGHRSTQTDLQQAINPFGRQKPSSRHIAREPLEAELCLSSLSSPLLANKLSGRHSAREPLEDALWPSRALLAASAGRCSSWRSAVSARGSR